MFQRYLLPAALIVLTLVSCVFAQEEQRPVRQKKRVVGMSTRQDMRSTRGKLARYYNSSGGIIAVQNPPEARGQLAYPEEEGEEDEEDAPSEKVEPSEGQPVT